MVTVPYLLFVITYFVQGALVRAEEPINPDVVATDYAAYDYVAATGATYPDYYSTDYGKPTVTYTDYTTDYGKPTVTYTDYTTDYGKPTVTYTDYTTGYVKPTYGDYAKAFYADYYGQYGDFAYNDYDYYHYYEDYGFYTDDYLHEYGDYFGYGDRNNPLDTAVAVYDDAAASSQVPWIYIIVPVLQVDLYYVDDEQKGIENIDLELPIETFLFELGDFGLGHLQLGDFGLSQLQWDNHYFGDYGNLGYDYNAVDYATNYDYPFAYEDFPVYGNYPKGSKPQMFDYAEQLDDFATMDYPAVDHAPLWVDWIFMVPPDAAEPVVR